MRSKYLWIGTGFTVFFFGVIYLLSTFFAFSVVSIRGIAQDQLVAGLNQYYRFPLFLINPQEVAQELKKANPLFGEVEVRKQYPDTLDVAVVMIVPHAQIQTGEGVILVSNDAVVVRKLPGKTSGLLPVVVFYQSIPFASYQSGDRLPFEDLRTALYFAQEVTTLGYRINRIDIESFHMIGLYEGQRVFLFSAEKDRTAQQFRLEQSIKLLKQTGRDFRRLDLRFEKPVVEY